jgi:hypothetical protein
LEAVLSDIKSRGGADMLVAAGDLLTEGPHPRETLEVLRTNNVQLLLGNHEEYLLGCGFENLRHREWGLVDRIQASNSWTLEQLDTSIVPFLDSQPHSLAQRRRIAGNARHPAQLPRPGAFSRN